MTESKIRITPIGFEAFLLEATCPTCDRMMKVEKKISDLSREPTLIELRCPDEHIFGIEVTFD